MAVAGDQRLAAGPQRGADPGSRARQPGQRGRHLADGLAHHGIGRQRLPRPAFLDQHRFGRRCCHAEVLQGLLGLPRLAKVVLLLAGGTEQLPDEVGHGD
jgi:hypothetical protein